MASHYKHRARLLHTEARQPARCGLCYWSVSLGPMAHADIFQWEYINPANPDLGKKQSTTLCIDGAGRLVAPGADLHTRNLTMGYLIGAEPHRGLRPRHQPDQRGTESGQPDQREL